MKAEEKMLATRGKMAMMAEVLRAMVRILPQAASVPRSFEVTKDTDQEAEEQAQENGFTNETKVSCVSFRGSAYLVCTQFVEDPVAGHCKGSSGRDVQCGG
jgi:hypothetical protein